MKCNKIYGNCNYDNYMWINSNLSRYRDYRQYTRINIYQIHQIYYIWCKIMEIFSRTYYIWKFCLLFVLLNYFFFYLKKNSWPICTLNIPLQTFSFYIRLFFFFHLPFYVIKQTYIQGKFPGTSTIKNKKEIVEKKKNRSIFLSLFFFCT